MKPLIQTFFGVMLFSIGIDVWRASQTQTVAILGLVVMGTGLIVLDRRNHSTD